MPFSRKHPKTCLLSTERLKDKESIKLYCLGDCFSKEAEFINAKMTVYNSGKLNGYQMQLLMQNNSAVLITNHQSLKLCQHFLLFTLVVFLCICQVGLLKKFTSAYLFQIAWEKSCDYLLIIYMNKFEMVEQKKRTRITQSGKNCAIIAPSRARSWFDNKRFDWLSVSFFVHWPIRMFALLPFFAFNYLFSTLC